MPTSNKLSEHGKEKEKGDDDNNISSSLHNKKMISFGKGRLRSKVRKKEFLCCTKNKHRKPKEVFVV